MSLFFPIGTDRPQRRLPWMNIAIIVANILIYLVGQALSRNAARPFRDIGIPPYWYDHYLLNPANPQLFQFLTYQFLHEGLPHIGFNMLFLYVFGNNLNEKLGHAGYLAFYLAGGILAGCGHVLTSDSPTLGASGAISAVTGLYLVLLPRTHIRMFVWFFVYIDVWEIPSLYFILFKIGQDIFEQMQPGSRSVAYMAHLSGTAAGILIGLLLLATKLVQRDHYDLLAMLNRFRRRAEYRSIVAQGYDPFDPTRGFGEGAGGAAGGRKGVAILNPLRKGAPAPVVDPRIQSLRDEIARLIRVHEIPAATENFLQLKGIDPAQVLPHPEQLDIANQLMSEARYPEAAATYEDFLRVYPDVPQKDDVALILGLIYSRYMPRPERAKELFRALLPRLHKPSERQLAETELQYLDTLPPSSSAP